jgi:signal transduction histidine kinase
MAPKILPYNYFKQSAKILPMAFRRVSQAIRSIAQPSTASIDYQRWCDHLILQRFWLSVILMVAFESISGIAEYHDMFIDPQRLIDDLNLLKVPHLLEDYRNFFVLHKLSFFVMMGLMILLYKSAWGKRNPKFLLPLFSIITYFIPSILLGMVMGVVVYPSTTMFMAQAVITPVYWRLHLWNQILSLSFFFLVYPLIGLGKIGDRDVHTFSNTVIFILVCVVCEVGVYIYEKSKRSELEANRRLKLCIHAITHDLRTPVIGSLMLLESMQKNTPANQAIQIPQLEMSHLIQGYDRLLGLMNTLLDNQALAQGDLVLNRQSTNLNSVFDTILQDFQPIFLKKNIEVHHQTCSDLPIANIDSQQIWRVLCNLISNAINHNPPGLLLTLDAVVVDQFAGRSHNFSRTIFKESGSMLKVIVQDNGVGISPHQKDTIFEPYSRTQQSQYQPGLGLGLYICRQIVLAHGGEIGLDCLQPGVRFWFTLPLQKCPNKEKI